MHTPRKLLFAALVATAAGLPGAACTDPEPRDEHRKIVVTTRGADEAYDILMQVLTQRFQNIDSLGTSREARQIVTEWVQAEEPDRLVRRRAVGRVSWDEDDEEAKVTVAIERQLSTKKTGFGELDRQDPRWLGSTDVADSTLEKEVVDAVRKRLGGK